MKILYGICGSISAYKAPWIVRELIRLGAEVRVVMTPEAQRFVTPLVLQNLSKNAVVTDSFDPEHQEGGSWHVHWARWADQVLVAPCSATTMAKLATGIADNALTLALLSLPRETPLRLCPAMDPDMWHHPATQRNLARLQADGALVLPPEEGELASGLSGAGRLPEPLQIAEWVLKPSLKGKTVLITAGPTREPIDGVRYISNHSSGKMGFAIAAEAQARGARVILVSGPVSLPAPAGVEIVRVETAQQMLEACQQNFPSADVIIKSAAVADFSPAQVASGKLKKEQLGQNPSIALEKTADILAWLGEHKRPDQYLVGFALEIQNAEENARGKLERKKCDLVVLNQANQPDSGFGGDNNTITLIGPDLRQPWPPLSKRQCARRLWDFIEGSGTLS
ncbi:MAG: bifunctional phosphopantothenoylcysteine decarboxylase/phosphopantothenate--cysteine ligase CoaBC [Candidatus Eremiobacteraeota bacterium]|nr:bifunctional phosphopantothenoylcysteine decarboxylase/phosphopantothenate--cysteine ligase CoaBC [Candidatus Eremiobacteraeota bacterium]